MPSICLCMMVKNEAGIIRRALESAIPFIDSWVICDTGSTDGTQAIIYETLQDIPGQLWNVPWVNFGANRTQVVKLARAMGDYLLILDADLVLHVDMPVKDLRERLTDDAYALRYQGDVDYTSTMLLASRHEWRYVGVTHEYVTSETAEEPSEIPGVTLIDHADGANRVEKCERDINLLVEDLKTDPYNPRSVFYIAQSYRGWEKFEHALAWYQGRVKLEGYDEERWYSMMMVGRLLQHLDAPAEEVRKAYLDAYFFRPTRLEPICWLAQYCRLNREPEMAFLFSSIAGTDMRYPSADRLFIDRPVYDYLMLYEFGMAATLTGRLPLATFISKQLNPRGPQEYCASLATTIDAMREHIANHGAQ